MVIPLFHIGLHTFLICIEIALDTVLDLASILSRKEYKIIQKNVLKNVLVGLREFNGFILILNNEMK